MSLSASERFEFPKQTASLTRKRFHISPTCIVRTIATITWLIKRNTQALNDLRQPKISHMVLAYGLFFCRKSQCETTKPNLLGIQ